LERAVGVLTRGLEVALAAATAGAPVMDVRAQPVARQLRRLAEGSIFSDVDRADVLFRMGVCRWTLSSISTAVALFDEALALCESSELPCDGLRSDIHHWRSRCRRRQRDFEAAREDADRALELATGVEDRRKMADAYFQASLVAERTGHWVLSRSYAEQAKALFQELDDERTVGRLLNNLGGLSLLLGKPEQAIEQLKASFAVALDVDSEADAGRAVNGLATVHLHLGEWEQAEAHARQAIALLEGREDFLGELGQTHLMLGRALMELGRLDEAEQSFRTADALFEQHESASHRAGAWVALGDLAARRGDESEAARLYRNAAETLQDLRF
ncbi:MAG TPA: tetratricopeptide repeat protein, partial [Gaiellaceae bacterium]|nr:tetratricopeptide repeat protein [Gaiellaceae bacterium]